MIKVSAPRRSGLTTVTFTVPNDVHDGPVSVVGDFNDWIPGMTPLARRWNRTRSAKVELGAGRYAFRYLAEGGVWLDEPDAPEQEGGNAVLVVPAERG